MDEKCPHGVHTDMTCEPCEVEASQDAETCHSLAVLGARVLANAVEWNGRDMDPTILEWAEGTGLTADECNWAYATPAIAATVARLTEGDSNG